ncbi:MAG: tRNA uridine-5-carboxymethylaminomethyl(34) synthesis GTPase MnmE [Bacteroides sp.]|nr:tRNA uridine-5-carboxymethylaminomethyl(34) synthesis GTPase MnmE [Bacteroides sp.]
MSTICAISTPSGIGGIAVARVSGPNAIETVDRVWKGKALAGCASHTAHLGLIVDPDRGGEQLDQAVATIFRTPNSFTGEDVVELSVHGSRFVQAELIRLLCRNGAHLAEPGEFTRRAFAAGKLDLAQAEAVADVIAANSRAALRVANTQMRGAFSARLAELRQQLIDLAALLELELDFSEEDVEFASRDRLRSLTSEILDEIERLRGSFAAGTAIKEGIPVAIAGPTNAGKSSLLNALLNDDRAIVSDIHGTTRDTVEDSLTIGDHLFRIIDTAGIRETPDEIERAGIQRSMRAIGRAAVVLAVTDASTAASPQPLLAEIRATAPATPVILLRNKSDLLTANAPQAAVPPHPSADPTDHTIPQTPSEGYEVALQIPTVGTTAPLTDANGPTASQTPAEGCEVALQISTIGTTAPLTDANGPTASQTPAIGDATAKVAADIVCELNISAKTGDGIDTLRRALTQVANKLSGDQTADAILVTNQRHYDALTAAVAPLRRLHSALTHTTQSHTPTHAPSHSSFPPSTPFPTSDSLSMDIPLDLLAQDLREALHHLSTITGSLTTPDILATIFSRFCIGK